MKLDSLPPEVQAVISRARILRFYLVGNHRIRSYEKSLFAALDALDAAPEPRMMSLERVRPKIVCLCGSTRFIDTFREATIVRTCAGEIVLSVGCNLRDPNDLLLIESQITSDFDALKVRLDELHKRKIDLADEILVLNVDGYIGESTASEIKYARDRGKAVTYWHTDALDREFGDAKRGQG